MDDVHPEKNLCGGRSAEDCDLDRQHERGRAATDAIAALGIAAAFLSLRPEFLVTNRPFDVLALDVFGKERPGRLRFVDALADDKLTRILSSIAAGSIDVPACVIALPARIARPPLVAQVVPWRPLSDRRASCRAIILTLKQVSRAEIVPASVVRELFDLTIAEARVATGIAGGASVAEIAAWSRTAEGTVRNQLKSIFAKTSTARQSELVALLGNLMMTADRGTPEIENRFKQLQADRGAWPRSRSAETQAATKSVP